LTLLGLLARWNLLLLLIVQQLCLLPRWTMLLLLLIIQHLGLLAQWNILLLLLFTMAQLCLLARHMRRLTGSALPSQSEWRVESWLQVRGECEQSPVSVGAI
jgi:hypothetical protein